MEVVENKLLIPFPKGISTKWNANNLVQVWTRVTDYISYDDNRCIFYVEYFIIHSWLYYNKSNIIIDICSLKCTYFIRLT